MDSYTVYEVTWMNTNEFSAHTHASYVGVFSDEDKKALANIKKIAAKGILLGEGNFFTNHKIRVLATYSGDDKGRNNAVTTAHSLMTARAKTMASVNAGSIIVNEYRSGSFV